MKKRKCSFKINSLLKTPFYLKIITKWNKAWFNKIHNNFRLLHKKYKILLRRSIIQNQILVNYSIFMIKMNEFF